MAVNSFREDEYMENTDKKKILSRLLSYLLDYKLAIAGVLVCMGITVGISLVNPLLIEEAIDHYIAQSDFKGLIALGNFCARTERSFYHSRKSKNVQYVRDFQ